MFYFKTAPWFLRSFYPKRLWQMPAGQKKIYLTFDDGPHPIITNWVLEELKKYNAFATFFCIGKNVVENPLTFQRIIEAGHSIGNHTHNHLNGFKTADSLYLQDIYEAKQAIQSSLFRPPYGRLTKFQEQQLHAVKFGLKVVMWTALSGDFDPATSKQKCLNNVLHNTKDGAIIVFHDSQKASEKLFYTLPKTLQYFAGKGFSFDKL